MLFVVLEDRRRRAGELGDGPTLQAPTPHLNGASFEVVIHVEAQSVEGGHIGQVHRCVVGGFIRPVETGCVARRDGGVGHGLGNG